VWWEVVNTRGSRPHEGGFAKKVSHTTLGNGVEEIYPPSSKRNAPVQPIVHHAAQATKPVTAPRWGGRIYPLFSKRNAPVQPIVRHAAQATKPATAPSSNTASLRK
jgi:hypothetical protein